MYLYWRCCYFTYSSNFNVVKFIKFIKSKLFFSFLRNRRLNEARLTRRQSRDELRDIGEQEFRKSAVQIALVGSSMAIASNSILLLSEASE